MSRPGYLADVFPTISHRELVSVYAVFGGMPRYLELASEHGGELVDAVDDLILDPKAPLHHEPDRILEMETPTATSLRPILLDVIGNGAHRLSEIAGRLGRQASRLAASLATLIEMDMIRRETPFGSDPKSGKRSLYQISDPFLRFWFRVVAPNRSLLADAPRTTGVYVGKSTGSALRHKRGKSYVAWQFHNCIAWYRQWRIKVRLVLHNVTGIATTENWISSPNHCQVQTYYSVKLSGECHKRMRVAQPYA